MTVSLRPMKPDDLPALEAIFRAAIEELAGEDYDEGQQEAWASAADDPAAFARRLTEAITLVAFLDGAMAGFASLKDASVLDMLYVRPDCAGQGVATALVDAVERLAAARGTTILTVDASDTAMPAFLGWGYTATQRNTVFRAGEWLSNTTMTKDLPPPQAASRERH